MDRSETLSENAIRKQEGIYKRYIKKILDIIMSLIMITVLMPVLLLEALLVRIMMGKPVVFKQIRPGKDEKLFAFYKFRTMTDERDESGVLLPDEKRLTDFGRFLRASSLDELPELFNILIGNMSFVGPRPQLVKDMVFMSQEQRMRHTVLPGLTGWAQVNGRNTISWDRKLELDLEYIDNITFIGDCKIIIITIIKVIKRDGICTQGMDTAEDYGDYLLRLKRISEANYYAGMEYSSERMTSFITNTEFLRYRDGYQKGHYGKV